MNNNGTTKMKNGRVRFDMHCHTSEGSVDSHIMAKQFADKLIDMGFGGMLVTDHNSYKGYECIKKSEYDNFVILKGIEYDTFDFGHFIIVMPDEFDTSLLEYRGMRLEKVINYVHNNGGIIGAAHPGDEPFLSFYSTGIRFGNYEKMKKFINKLDFLEVNNASSDDESNRLANNIVKKYRKCVSAGSDAHKADCIGLGYTWLPQSIKNNNDLINYYKKKPYIETKATRYGKTLKDKLGRLNKLLVLGFFPYNKYEALKGLLARNKYIRAQKIKADI